MKEQNTIEEYTSFDDYMKKIYPKKEIHPLDTGGFKSVGARMAHESLELLKELLTDSKIVCKP
ncbi:hypothetical protein [Desulfomonile tiedjei]|uniref:Uncharacterized protein n=1 Tax=Desulfomonile tiedjei (strain ATCC 49306 / DSM 6799 / DCB-1) TaxID=706587 RepID=I4CCW7_DESTA|nr:hypothetical protein [Desulfomonile tiedjei]AFM27408.1 hypothetical protein Desti_4789 [Desulfomonile tiedjei DSM 6799]